MTTPASASRDGLEPDWRDDTPPTYSDATFSRYVPGAGVLRVIPADFLNSLTGVQPPAGGHAWYLSVTSNEILTSPRAGFATARDAMRDADQVTARRLPGVFEHLLDPGAAQRLYMRLYRAADLGITPRGPYNPDLAAVLEELFTLIRIQAMAPDYDGPDPWKIHEQAGKWRKIAARTGLRDSDFSPEAVQAGWRAAGYMVTAAEQLAAGRPDAADSELRYATSMCEMTADGLRSRGLIEILRAKMNEATATDMRGRPIRPFARVVVNHPRTELSRLPGHGESGIVEAVCAGSERRALVYPEGRHLWPGRGIRVAYSMLDVHGYGPDPVTPAAAEPHASYLPVGVTLTTADRKTLATAIRDGLTSGGTRNLAGQVTSAPGAAAARPAAAVRRGQPRRVAPGTVASQQTPGKGR